MKNKYNTMRAIRPSATAALALLLILTGTPSFAAKFNLVIPKPAVKVGGETTAYIELIPETGDKIMGGWLTLTVNPQFILLPTDKNRFASDAEFSKVEKFSVDPVGGTITYRVQTEKPLDRSRIFLELPMKFVAEGVSSVSFTAQAYHGEDLDRKPANSGYQRVAGVVGAVDPIIFSTLVGENTTLKETSLAGTLEPGVVGVGGDGLSLSSEAVSMDLGVTTLQKAESDADAAVVVEFSKRQKTIGLRQWIRLDVIVTKFPEGETLSGAQMKIKYDPNALMFTNAVGQESSTIEVNDVFSIPFINKVDRLKGEIEFALGTGFNLDNMLALQPPAKVVSLYFKGLRETNETTVVFEDVKVPVSDSNAKLAVHHSNIVVSASQSGCDSDLPATLCSGSFKVSGTVAFTLSNKNETTRSVTTILDGQKSVASNVRVKRYFLEQSWNMHMDGSFRNGIRLQGSLVDYPAMEQMVNLELLASDWSAHFGDFNTSFQESGLVQLLSSEVTGLQLKYNYKKFRFRALSAELKSSPGQTSVTGNGQTGPYVFANSANPIIPASVRVFDYNNRIMAPDEYTIDYGRYQIYFKEPLLTNQTVVIKFQQSSLLFSTGNIQAYRADYNPDNENFKVGATYLTTMSPKSSTFVKLSTSEAIDSSKLVEYKNPDGSTYTTYPCPTPRFEEGHTCSTIKLSQQYVVKDSIKIQNDTADDKTSYTESSPYMLMPHRGYIEGTIVIDRTNKFRTVKMNITYAYYNPSLISQPAIIAFNIQGKQFTDRGMWPSTMFPGSEMLYLSDDANQYDITEGSDEIVCHKSTIEEDDANFCPGTYVPKSVRTYYLEGQDNYTYAQFDGVVTDKKYLKVKYIPVPYEISGGSEFQKTAWNVDTSFGIGKKMKVKAEYAMANSDLSASFNTVSEEILVDVRTNPSENTQTGSRCIFSGLTNPVLTCSLNQKSLSGSMKIQIQKCDLVADSVDTCIETSENVFKYSDMNLYDVIIPTNDIDRKEGTFKITPKNWRSDAPITYAAFPVLKGDKFTITYTYDQSLDRIATGDAYYLNAAYENKNVQFSIDKRGRDPLFDKAVSKFNDNYISRTAYDLSVKAGKKVSIKYNSIDALEQNVDKTGAVTSSYSNPSKAYSLNWTISKSGSFSLNHSENQNKGETIGSDGNKTLRDTKEQRNSYGLLFSMRKMKYNFALARSETKNQNRVGTQPGTVAGINKFSFDYRMSRKYNFKYSLDTTDTKPTSATAENRAYEITLMPLTPLNIRLGLVRSNTKSGSTSAPTTTENLSYNLGYTQLKKFKAITMAFTRATTPGNTIDNPFTTQNDSFNFNFSISPSKNLTIKPSLNRARNSQESKSWSLTHTKSWNATYNKKIKKKDSINTTYTQNSNRTNTANFQSTGNVTNIISGNTQKKIDLRYTKPSGTTVSTSFSTTAGSSTSRQWSTSFSRKLSREILFSTSVNLTRSFGSAPSKVITSRMGFDWSLDANTKFSLSYSRDLTRYSLSTTNSNSTTSFQTSLTTTFR